MIQFKNLFKLKNVVKTIVMSLTIGSALITFSSSALAEGEKEVNISGFFFSQLPKDTELKNVKIGSSSLTGSAELEFDTAFRVGYATSKATFKGGPIGIAHSAEVFYTKFAFDTTPDEEFSFQSLGFDFGYGPAVNISENAYLQILPFIGAGVVVAEFEAGGASTTSETAYFWEYGVKAALNMVMPGGFQLGVFGGYLVNTQTVEFVEGASSVEFDLETSGSFVGASIGKAF